MNVKNNITNVEISNIFGVCWSTLEKHFTGCTLSFIFLSPNMTSFVGSVFRIKETQSLCTCVAVVGNSTREPTRAIALNQTFRTVILNLNCLQLDVTIFHPLAQKSHFGALCMIAYGTCNWRVGQRDPRRSLLLVGTSDLALANGQVQWLLDRFLLIAWFYF